MPSHDIDGDGPVALEQVMALVSVGRGEFRYTFRCVCHGECGLNHDGLYCFFVAGNPSC